MEQVRRLHDADLVRWSALWRAYLSFYRAEMSEQLSELTFRALSAQERGMLGLVAVDPHDQPVGLAHLVFHSSTWSAKDYCYLEDLYVDPEQRGGQVARRLFEAVYATAAQRGAGRVYWHTQQFNSAARSLYDTVGQLTSFVVYEHPVG